METAMHTPQRNPSSAIVTSPIVVVALVFLTLSATKCHAMACPTWVASNGTPPPSVTSISPNVWVPGQTYNVVVTGNLTGNSLLPGCTYDEIWAQTPDDGGYFAFSLYGAGPSIDYISDLSASNAVYLSPTQIGFTITVAPNAPAEAVTLGLTCDGCGLPAVGTALIAPLDNGSNLGPCTQCQSQAGAPINVTNGNVWVQQSDYSLPGLGGGLGLVRTWNSRLGSAGPPNLAGMFGLGWRSTYEEMLAGPDSNNNLKYWRGDGSAWTFAYNSTLNTYSLTSPPNVRAQLVSNPTGGFTLTLADGTQRVFNGQGLLASIIDRNNNQTTLAYDSSNRLTSVTSAGGTTLSFTYGDPNNPSQATTVQDAVGLVATYTYDGSSRLTQVSYPDGSAFNFTYDPTYSMLLSVTDSQGKLIEAHTYDTQNRGLTSTRANGVDSVSLSY
jgi:YD repeat-containing protein